MMNMNGKRICLSVVIVCLLTTPASYGVREHHRPMIAYDASRSVTIEVDTNGTAYGHVLLWRANTTGTNYEESAVVYIEETAYIGSCSTHGDGHDKVFAVDTTDGSILWSVPIGPGYVGPVIDDDRVYIGTSSHGYDPANEYVFCINRSDGAIIWSRNIYGGIPESIQYDDSNIYFTSNIIYALDKYDGTIRWTYQMDEFSVTKPLLKDNAFFTATAGGTMYKVDVSDGSLIWEVTLSDFSWDNSITADGAGMIYLALYGDRTINAYDEATGDLVWSYQLRRGSLSFNAYHNEVLFISDTSGYVYALDSASGTFIWENKLGDVIDISSPTISGGLLFIGTRDFEEGSFFALDESNGDILWRYTVGSSVTAPPSIADGIMFCGTDDWHMYAFDVGVGNSDWLLHRFDAANTAYSPNGLMHWQYVSASCTTLDNTTTCDIENLYDYDVENVTLKLPEGVHANWYDTEGGLLKSQSDHYVIADIASLSSLTIIIKIDLSNHPDTPVITGPTSGVIGREYAYTVSTADPDGDDISYYIDWGDGSATGWTSTISSGETITASHVWSEKATYTVKAKAKDVYGAESDWGHLQVSMPYYHTPFRDILENVIEWLIAQLLNAMCLE